MHVIPDCIQPLIFEDEDTEFPYGVIGTGFFVSYRSQIYLLTARHCFGTTSEEVKQNIFKLRVPVSPGTTPDLVPLKSFAIHFDDTARDVLPGGSLDIAAIQIDQNQLWVEEALRPRCIELPENENWTDPSGLIGEVRGFPVDGTATNIDYESRHLNTQHAVYVGTVTSDSTFPHTMRIDFLAAHCPVQALNGISGAPVFLVDEDKNGIYYRLGGMMIRGGNMKGYFVTLPWILAVVRELSRRRPKS